MHVDSDTYSYRLPPEQIGYYELSSAIVRTAVEDYRAFKMMQLNDGRSKRAQYLVDDLRTFFMSSLFEAISGVANPNAFLLRLDEQIEKEFNDGTKRKRHKSTLQFK